MSVMCGQCDARHHLYSQLQGINAHWLVPNYTFWRQRHMNVTGNNLSRVALDSGEAGIRTCDLLIESPAVENIKYYEHKHACYCSV